MNSKQARAGGDGRVHSTLALTSLPLPLLSPVSSELTSPPPPLVPYPGSEVEAWTRKIRITATLATVLPHDQVGLSMNCCLSDLGAPTMGLLHCSPIFLDANLFVFHLMAANIYWTACYVSSSIVSAVHVLNHAILTTTP